MEKETEKPTYDELAALVVTLQERIATLEQELAAAKKNSRNSSKPPSSDFTNPPPKDKGSGQSKKKRKKSIGGQPGHSKPEEKRTLNDADKRLDYYADQEEAFLGRSLVPAPGLEPRILFQYELVEKPVELVAHVSYPYIDLETDEVVYAPFPSATKKAGILGPRLTAFTAFLKGAAHSSYSTVQEILAAFGVDVSRGTIVNKIQKVSAALEPAYSQLLNELPLQPRLNVDETGHKDNPYHKTDDHKKHWTWVFAAPAFTLFRIFDSRSTDALREVLGEDCEAILGSDLYSAYTCFAKESRIVPQYCWAHLIRDICFLSEASNKTTANYGERLLKIVKKIFKLYHQRDELDETIFQKKMRGLKEAFLKVGTTSKAAGTHDLVKRLKAHGDDYFLFIENPGVEPTNNLAEREIRHCVIDRRITQGTRGDPGQRWCERIWTILATCARQGRDAFSFIAESIHAHFHALDQPMLLPTT